MAVESRTVGELVARVNHALTGNTTVDPALAVEIKWALTFAMRQMVLESDHPAFRTEATLNTTQGNECYDLPDDFVRMIEPGVKHLSSHYEALYLLDQQTADRDFFDARFKESQDRPRYYVLRGRNADWTTGAFIIRLIPVPDDTYGIQFTYFSSPKDMSQSPDDEEIDRRFPRDFVDGIVEYAKFCFPQYLEREQCEHALLLFERSKAALRRSSKPYVGRAWQNERFGSRPVAFRQIQAVPDPGEPL